MCEALVNISSPLKVADARLVPSWALPCQDIQRYRTCQNGNAQQSCYSSCRKERPASIEILHHRKFLQLVKAPIASTVTADSFPEKFVQLPQSHGDCSVPGDDRGCELS